MNQNPIPKTTMPTFEILGESFFAECSGEYADIIQIINNHAQAWGLRIKKAKGESPHLCGTDQNGNDCNEVYLKEHCPTEEAFCRLWEKDGVRFSKAPTPTWGW